MATVGTAMATRTSTRDWADIDLYATLEVAPDASADDIARAYRRLAKQLHPDAGAEAARAERFKEIVRAYQVLGDVHRRREYDRVREELVRARTTAREGAPVTRLVRPRRMSRRAAWVALVAGVTVTVAGIVVGVLTWTLRERDAERRGETVPVVAERLAVDGEPFVAFTVDGERVVAPEPERTETGVAGSTLPVRYDPDDPTSVIADERNVGRDITLAIVALKLLVGGPVFVVVGARRLRG